MKKVFLMLGATGLVFCWSESAFADDHEGVSGYVAAGAVMIPEYEGSEDYELSPAVAFRAEYDGYYVESAGLGLKANVSPYENVEFGPVLSFNMGRDDDVENEKVKRLREIDDSFEGGFFVAVPFNGIWHKADQLTLEVEMLTDLSDTHEGTRVRFGPSYGYQLTSKLRLTGAVEATYASDDYMKTYFGIDANNAARSGLSQFEAEGGIKNVGLSVVGNYSLNDKWGIIGMAGYDKLMGDAADSPIVDDEGSDNQFMFLTGVTYSF